MVPWSIAFILAGLGTQNIPADRELQVRAAVLYPSDTVTLSVSVNADGEFHWREEPWDARKTAHHSLKVESPQFGGPVAEIEALSAWAGDGISGNSPVGLALAAIGIQCCRARLADHPDDAAAVTCLGTLLDQVGRPDEAERWLRHATATAPRNWRTWQALADHYMRPAYRKARSVAVGVPTDSMSMAYYVSDPAVRRARYLLAGDRHLGRWLRAAGDCHDWAVLFAPTAVEPLLARVQWELMALNFAMFSTRDEGLRDTWLAHSRRLAADARRLADLTGHPSAYGFAFSWGLCELAGRPDEVAVTRSYWARAAGRLQAMLRDPDPLTRVDAARTLILVRCFAFQDFSGARPLLDLLPDRPGDQTPLVLADLVLDHGLNDPAAMAELLDRRLVPADARDYFFLATIRRHSGPISRALDAVRDGLQKFPDDPQLNLTRTALLLRYGSATDLVEVHFRLSAAEATFAARRAASVTPDLLPVGWTEKDQQLLELTRLHRAIYLGLIGRTTGAVQVAADIPQSDTDAADAAAKLLAALDPAPADSSAGGWSVRPRAGFLPQPATALPNAGPAPDLPVLKRTEYLSPADPAILPKSR